MKRTLSVIILASMLISLAACGGETPEKETGTSAVSGTTAPVSELSEYEKYPLPEKNMENFELRFYNYTNTWLTWAVNELDAEEETGDNVNDAIYRRNRRVEGKYNCQISETKVEKTDSNFRSLMMSGDDLYDIVMVYDENVSRFYCEGLTNSWDVFEYVDTERSWWNSDANEIFSIKGKQIAAVGDFTLAMISRGFVMLFNKEIISNSNFDDNLYDLVRDGKWTLDKFASMAKNLTVDLNGDGKYDINDQFAAAGAIKLHFGSLITGCGVKYISVDNDGNPYFAIPGNTYAFDVFEKIFNIHNGSNIFLQVVDGVHNGSNESRDMFKAGRLAFQGTSTKAIANYRDAEFDIGIIPYPKYDENQDRYYVLTSGAGVAAIPITLSPDRFENVGILIDALSRDSHEDLLPTYREVVLKTKYTRDEDSAEMLDLIFNSGTYDLGLSMFPNVTYYKYMESYMNMVDNFASMTESIKPQVEAEIGTLLETLEKNS